MASILVNHVYYSPVGHVVEAIRYARGFRDANPGSEIHVALSDGAPWELCAGAPWIAGIYRIPVADPGSCGLSVPEMPREWDYIVDNNLMALEDPQYPGAESWITIIGALRERFPLARFYLTGARGSDRHRHLTTTRYRDDGLARILASGDDLVDCYDIGLWHQVALLEACDLLVSPHSGFSFLALCVSTPWLTISGGNWPEFFFNGVPFYSVLPDNPDYPYVGAYDYDYDGPTIPDMRHERLLARIPDILAGAAFLLDPATTYQDALARHRANVARARIRHDRMPEVTG
jgi:hypothetical protein